MCYKLVQLVLNNMSKFRANGKFLLTGEYLVLQGALALALPLKLGQTLEVNTLNINNGVIHWDAFTPKGFWFSAMLNKNDLTVRASDDMQKAEMLSKIFQVIKSLNPNILQENCDYSFTTHLEFDKEWGLGSSSTLISCLSQWANVNPYEVLKQTMGGSGYDIACATALKPILYRLEDGNPIVEEVDFKPDFSDKLYFVYQNHKQSSGKEVKSFKERLKTSDFSSEIREVSVMSDILSGPCLAGFDDFCAIMEHHEEVVGKCICQNPLKSQFKDFQGVIKSLGAWGGDFFLAATKLPETEVRRYFQGKGLTTVFRYDEIVI